MNTKQTGHGDKKENKSVHFCVAFIRPSLAVPISNDFYKMRRRLTSQPKCTNFREKKTYCSLRQWVFISGSFLLFFFSSIENYITSRCTTKRLKNAWTFHEIPCWMFCRPTLPLFGEEKCLFSSFFFLVCYFFIRSLSPWYLTTLAAV